jgi:thiamine biosynthesis lipoprotein
VEAAFAAVAKVQRLMSFHDMDSDLARLNREAAAHTVTVHPWTFEVLAVALDVQHRSAGVFDIAVAPVLQHFGSPGRPCGGTAARTM